MARLRAASIGLAAFTFISLANSYARADSVPETKLTKNCLIAAALELPKVPGLQVVQATVDQVEQVYQRETQVQAQQALEVGQAIQIITDASRAREQSPTDKAVQATVGDAQLPPNVDIYRGKLIVTALGRTFIYDYHCPIAHGADAPTPGHTSIGLE